VGEAAAQVRPEPFYFIREFRVSGSTLLSGLEISKLVYPFLGPGRRAQDIELARQALEAAAEDAAIEDALYSLGKALEVRPRAVAVTAFLC
jgi:hypothetical protein